MTTPRELEQLVARIEAALGPTGAVVKSPDYLIDRVTWQRREVDVSITFRAGSVNMLLTVECRDRTKTEDVTWMEQLATKQKHVGAAHTIAVSTTGFSEPALKAAKAHNISARTISEIVDADILAWASKLEVESVETTCTLGNMAVVFVGEHEVAPQLDEPSKLDWHNRGFDAAIFREGDEGTMISLAQLIARASAGTEPRALRGNTVSVTLPPLGEATFSKDPLAVLARGLPHDGSTTKRTFTLKCEGESIAANTTTGLFPIRQVVFEVSMSSTRTSIPIARVLKYAGEDTPSTVVAEREVALDRSSDSWVITHFQTLPDE